VWSQAVPSDVLCGGKTEPAFGSAVRALAPKVSLRRAAPRSWPSMEWWSHVNRWLRKPHCKY